MKVVVAEVDPVLRADFQRKFATWGHKAVCVADGPAAWKAIQSDVPDMVILDWELPGLDGLEICQRLRESETLPYIYLIMLTEKQHENYMVAGFTVGVDDFIVKPVDDVIVQTRIVVGTRIATYERALSKRNEQLRQRGEELEALAETRAQQSALAERLATAAMLSADASHSLEDPMAFVDDHIRTLATAWCETQRLLRAHLPSGPDCDRLAQISQDVSTTLEQLRSGLEPVSNIMLRLMAHHFIQDHADTPQIGTS